MKNLSFRWSPCFRLISIECWSSATNLSFDVKINLSFPKIFIYTLCSPYGLSRPVRDEFSVLGRGIAVAAGVVGATSIAHVLRVMDGLHDMICHASETLVLTYFYVLGVILGKMVVRESDIPISGPYIVVNLLVTSRLKIALYNLHMLKILLDCGRIRGKNGEITLCIWLFDPWIRFI